MNRFTMRLSYRECLGLDAPSRVYNTKFTAQGAAGAASSTAATAGIIKIEQPATAKAVKLYEWELAPAANATDANYGLQLKRQTTSGTWTAVTPNAIDQAVAAAATTVAGRASTAAGTASSVLLQVGCNQRAGYRWVAVPGSEFILGVASAAGIILEYFFAQDTSVNNATMFFDE